MQLDSLARNDEPHLNHGILLLYNFALFDPWSRSDYFGRKMDLGQFERFRNVLHTHAYRVLLRNSEWRILSEISPSDNEFWVRVHVIGFRPGEEGYFNITLKRLVGGYRDGCWMTTSMVCDDPLWMTRPVSY